MQYGLGNAKPLEHALRVCADPPIGRVEDSDEIEHCLDALIELRPAEVGKFAQESEIFATRKLRVIARTLGQVADVSAQPFDLGLAENLDRAFIRYQ
jgi:hypothetical protein